MTTSDISALEKRIEALSTEIVALRERLDVSPGVGASTAKVAGGQTGSGPVVSATPTVVEPVSRRHALRTAGVVAAGAIAGGVAMVSTAGPAAAATGSFDSSVAGTPAVTATANAEGGTAVRADATQLGATGVVANGDEAGVHGTGANAGVYGSSLLGYGVFAESTSGIGLFASGGQVGGVFVGALAALVIAAVGTPPPTRVQQSEPGMLTADATGALWYCTASGIPGTWRLLADPSSAGTFHALAPGRVYDSRWTDGPLSTGQSRPISVADRRNSAGVDAPGFVPVGATAVAANVTVTDTVGSGYLAVNPGGDTNLSASTINWFAAGQTLANGVSLTLNGSRQLTVVAGGPGSTNFIVDIAGYYL